MLDQSEDRLIATSLRIPETRNTYLKRKAKEIGVSQNSLIMMLLDIGIRCYEQLGQGSSGVTGSDILETIRSAASRSGDVLSA